MSRIAQVTKQAGVTQRWVYLARAQGIPEETVVSLGRMVQRAARIFKEALVEVKQDLSPLENSIQMGRLHDQVKQGFEPLISVLGEVGQSLAESQNALPILGKFTESAAKSWVALERLIATLKRNDWNSYKGDPEVGKRASEKYLQLLGKVIAAFDKGQQVLAKIPTAKVGDYGFTKEEWVVVKKKVAAILAKAIRSGIALTGGLEENISRPQITDQFVMFNGADLPGEDFLFYRRPHVERKGFCKTGQEAYEPVVIAILLALKKAFPQVLEVHVTDNGQF